MTREEAIHLESMTGKWLGFPDCCIKRFIERSILKEELPEGPWRGSGFIPCDTCLPSASMNFDLYVKENITPNRICRLPFPLDPWSFDRTRSSIEFKELEKELEEFRNYKWPAIN